MKKNYNIGDDVWIHGVAVSNKLTKGKVIANVDLSTTGYTDLQYVIEIPTHIEPLLEIRTWHTMSQDENGPIGSFRSLKEDFSANNKKMRQVGYVYSEDQNDVDDPTPAEILAALEKSTDGLTHKPLHIKESKPKRKYFPRKKKS